MKSQCHQDDNIGHFKLQSPSRGDPQVAIYGQSIIVKILEPRCEAKRPPGPETEKYHIRKVRGAVSL